MIVYIIIMIVAVLLASSAVVALFWAARHGQFRDLNGAPTVIFDADEPVGKATDAFPDNKSKQQLGRFNAA